MAFQKKQLSIIVLIAWLTVMVGFIINNFSDDFDDLCKKHLGEYYWQISLGSLSIFSVWLAYLTTDFGKKLFSQVKGNDQPAAKNFESEIRDWLRKRYQQRLDQKLAGRLPINLRRIDFTETAAQLSQKKFKEIAPEAVEAELAEFFKTAEGRLLVVGSPGAGKTTLLLQLAVALLDSQPDALPAVVNLATWTSEFKTLEDWLKKVLPIELGASTGLAVKLLTESRVILLFDGLDEIQDAGQRTACLAAIDLFTSPAKPRREFAISSRTKEWLEAKKVSNVAFAMEVGPLEMAQIERELTRRNPAQPEDRDLLAALKTDRWLREAAETPFYFNCLQLLFGENRRPVFSADDLAGREMEILDAFVENELGKCEKPGAKDWLAFLASRMNGRGLVRFELRDLQYDWWDEWTQWDKFLFPVFVYRETGKNTVTDGIINYEEITWNQEFLYKFFKKLCQPKNYFFFYFITVFWAFLGGAVYDSGDVSDIEKDAFFIGSALFILVALLSQVILIFVETSKQESKPALHIANPYQRFLLSLRFAGFSILQHFVLRLQLSKKGLLPLRLVDFLNEMASYQVKTRRFTTSAVHLLESDGASWRFRHRLIQEWFAARWQEPEAK